MLVKIKSCPFCGGEAERFTIGDDEPSNAGGDVITCTKCGASSHVEFGRKENLVSRWNTRTQPAPSGEVGELVRQAFYAGCEAGIKNYGGGNVQANWDIQFADMFERLSSQPKQQPGDQEKPT